MARLLSKNTIRECIDYLIVTKNAKYVKHTVSRDTVLTIYVTINGSAQQFSYQFDGWA